MSTMHKKYFNNYKIYAGGLLLLAILLVWGVTGSAVTDDSELQESVWPGNIVSYFETVPPDSFGSVGAVVIGTKQASLEDLNKEIRPAGGKVLIVTSITAYHITPTNKAPFSVVDLLGLKNDSTRGWGNGGLSVSGLQTTQVNYQPGLVVKLMDDETLSIRSFLQSNDTVRVGIHGYLTDIP